MVEQRKELVKVSTYMESQIWQVISVLCLDDDVSQLRELAVGVIVVCFPVGGRCSRTSDMDDGLLKAEERNGHLAGTYYDMIYYRIWQYRIEHRTDTWHCRQSEAGPGPHQMVHSARRRGAARLRGRSSSRTTARVTRVRHRTGCDTRQDTDG